MDTQKSWITLPYTTHDFRDHTYCDDCPMKCRTTITFVPFEIVGSNPHPSVLFIAESPFKDEMSKQRPLIGDSGTLLRTVLDEFLSEYALANIVSCHPSNVRLGPKAPDKDTIEYCRTHVEQFIKQVQPKSIILLGATAIHACLPESYKEKIGKDIDTVGKMIRKAPEYIDGISYACMYHPSYIIRDGGVKSEKYPEYRQRLHQILESIPNHVETVAPVIKFTSHTLDHLGFILQALAPYQNIGLDYEALDLDPWKTTNRVTGFSLSIMIEGERGRSYFIQVNRDPTPEERETLIRFLREKTIWAYNLKYEMNTTWAWLGVRIHFDCAFVLCKIDCSPMSLKKNAQKYVKADLWEEEVYNIVQYYTIIFHQISLLQEKFPEITMDLLAGRYVDASLQISKLEETQAKKFKKFGENVEYLLEYISLEDLIWGLQRHPYAWGAIPLHILSEYCCWDSFLTLKVKDHFWEKYQSVYPYYRSQSWLAGSMEAYGYNWSDTRAKELQEFYLIEGGECLYKLIQMIDIEDTQKYDAKCLYFGQESPGKKIELLKKIFNPLSNDPKAQAPFWSVYRTPETETWSFFNYLEHEILQSQDLEDEKFIPAIDKTDFNATVSALYEKAVGFKEMEAMTDILKKSEQGINAYFQRYAREVTGFQYEAHKKYAGVDIDKEETWNDQFRMLYYLVRFRKIMKSESTYIRGVIGRQGVSLASFDPNKLLQPPRRMLKYEECPPKYELKPNERWILNSSFMENGADTKRWKSGMHLVPASSEIREIYTPRSASALMFHADYSQNEVRFLAAMAKEENLLAAFSSGTDIHRYVASKIFKKSPEEITPKERDCAKSATFGLLYGKGVVTFAQDMMGGDLEAARQFFIEFFSAFPGVQEYITQCRKQVLRYGYVNTILGDPVYIDQLRYREDEVLRRSQNYPIQSSASSLGAHAISLLNESLIKRGIAAIPLGFCHDAADFEVEIPSLFSFIDLMHFYMVTYLRKHFHVPVGIDWSIGIHQQHMMKLEKKDGNVYKFACPKQTFDAIIARLRTHFVVDYTIENEEEKYVSLSELFMEKGGFSRYLGENISLYKGILTILS